MAKIFLSYSRQDQAFVSQLADSLAPYGHTAFFDDVIVPGQEWESALSHALQAADALVAIISPASAESQFVMTEIGAALAYARESGRMLVIPVILDDTKIPVPLRSVQAIFARDRSPLDVASEIEKALTAFLGARVAAQEKREEARQRIERNAADYVGDAVSAQKKAEKRYRLVGITWYAVGLVALLAGLVFVGLALLKVSVPNGDWTTFALIALRALIVIALLGACAKYAFALGRSFTIESLKCSDRTHAISFGEFYLRAYGDQAQWQDLKEAFANWNIDRASAFSGTSASDFDPKLVEIVTAVVQGLAPGKKS
jgi:hypothetical protein